MAKKKVKKNNTFKIIPAIIGGLILWYILNSYQNMITQSKKNEEMKRHNKGKELLEKLMNDNSKK